MPYPFRYTMVVAPAKETTLIYLSVDIEASGPFPGQNSLSSLGAIPVVRHEGSWRVDTDRTFYCEVQPQLDAADVPEAMAIHGLTREHLSEHGLSVDEALTRFRAYFEGFEVNGKMPILAAWPASFDGPFIGWLAQRELGENPFGYNVFDIISYALGLFRCVDRRELNGKLKAAGIEKPPNQHPHHALHDAIAQGQTLAWLLNRADARVRRRERRLQAQGGC